MPFATSFASFKQLNHSRANLSPNCTYLQKDSNAQDIIR